MLDHVEIVFENMKPMMKKLKKKNYKINMEEFLETYGHYFQEMTEMTENAENKDAAADEIAREQKLVFFLVKLNDLKELHKLVVTGVNISDAVSRHDYPLSNFP